MRNEHACFAGRWLRAVALLAMALATCLPRPAHALDICVQSVGDLVDGLQQVQVFHPEGTVTLRLVAQTYPWNDSVNYVLLNRLNLLGGYNADCTARTVDPANTVIDGVGGLDLVLYEAGLGLTVEGVQFRDTSFLSVLTATDECFDYGQEVTWRRSIVDTDYGGFQISNGCGDVILQNNLVRARYGTTIYVSPSALPADAFITNNTFIDSFEGDGLELFHDEVSNAAAVFYISNNIMWNNSGVGLTLRYLSAVPEVHALHNLWDDAALPLDTTVENYTLDPQLDVNGVPAIPGSPAINSGFNNPPGGLPAVDIVGNQRLIGSAADRGAYESNLVDITELVVTNASDSGPGSLRQAIIDANSNSNFNTIRFEIPGSGSFLLPQTPYPDIVTSMRIDGFTQAGALPNTSDWSNSADYRIDIGGSGTVSYAFRVPLNAPASTQLELRGLRIGGFNNAVLLQSGTGHIVRGNHFGKFGDGFLSGSDNLNAIYVNGSADEVDIGGIDPAERNSIAGDPDPIAGNGFGIYLGGSGDYHSVIGNLIGTFPDGNTGHGHEIGIHILTPLSAVLYNVISGNVTGIQLSGDDNLVASNRIGVKAFVLCLPPCTPDYALPNIHGIHVFAGAEGNDISYNEIAYSGYSGLILYPDTRETTMSANRVYSSGTFDLDLREPAGMNAIDGDGVAINGCDEANCDQNFPQLDAAIGGRYSGHVQGTLSTFNGSFRIEFFSGSECGAGGQGGASRYLGAEDVEVTGGSIFPPINGTAVFDLPVSSAYSFVGDFITATATSPGGNTSEYSACVAYLCDRIFAHDFEDATADTCPAP